MKKPPILLHARLRLTRFGRERVIPFLWNAGILFAVYGGLGSLFHYLGGMSWSELLR